MACRTWKHPHAIAISQKFTFKIVSRIQSSDRTVTVPSMKRLSARNADKRFANSRLRGVSGGRVRRHCGAAGDCARSGQGDVANQAR
jgi:hypothetical protein